MSGKLDNILQASPAKFKTMKNGDMVTEVIGDKVTSYLKHNNAIYRLNWEKYENVDNPNPVSEIESNNFKKGISGYKIDRNGQADLSEIKFRNSINNLSWKFFTGTAPAKQAMDTIAHGIPNGRQRIVCVSANIKSDTSPSPSSGTIPTNSMIAGAGNIQDESDEDWDYKTFYDDTNIYFFIDTTADDITGNTYVISVFYADYDLY